MLSLYKSSAGSGKTFTLVKEYLKLCLPSPSKYKSIVAITFTNAAATEMKERILDKLRSLAGGNDAEYKAVLLQEGLSESDIANAPKVLENILYDYSRFNVSTIDSFFHKILRSFGKELGLPLDFEIFLETEDALEYAVDNFIRRSFSNPSVHKILVEFINEKISNSSSWAIHNDLYRIARELLSDDTFLIQEPDLEKVQDFIIKIRKIISDFENQMDRIGNSALKVMQDNGIDIPDFKYGKSGPANYFSKIRKPSKDYMPGVRFLSAITDSSEWITKTSKVKSRLEGVLPELIPLAEDALSSYAAMHPSYCSAKEVLRNIYTFSVYEEIHKLLLEYKEQNEVVLISDFNRILANHLLQEQISFIYSRVGVRFEHFLIDEFQDTSSLQWLNLRPLIENSISQGAHCLLVGDSKQAIYRWRGGQVELIEKQVFERDFPDNCRKISLNNNFRSRREVVEFNNYFFKEVLTQIPDDFYEHKLLKQIFSDVNQYPSAKEVEGGYVEISFIQKESLKRDSFLEPAREKLLQTINDSLALGFGLKDITILVRNNRDAGEAAQLLFANGVDFISPDSLFLDKSPAVRLLFSLLNFLKDTRNNLARTELLYIYLQYFYLEEKAFSPNEVFSDFSQSQEGLFIRLLPEDFTEKISLLAAMPLYELVESLIRIFAMETEPDAYVQRFREVVLEYTRQHKFSISVFLDWWKDGKYSIVMPEDVNAVRIMTIHKSKGLEFPVVIVPFADWNFRSGQPDILWIEPDTEPFNTFEKLPVLVSPRLENSTFNRFYKREESLIAIDNLNLLYVAFTRARDRLYVVTEKHKNEKESITSVSGLMAKVLRPNGNNAEMEVMRFGK